MDFSNQSFVKDMDVCLSYIDIEAEYMEGFNMDSMTSLQDYMKFSPSITCEPNPLPHCIHKTQNNQNPSTNASKDANLMRSVVRRVKK